MPEQREAAGNENLLMTRRASPDMDASLAQVRGPEADMTLARCLSSDLDGVPAQFVGPTTNGPLALFEASKTPLRVVPGVAGIILAGGLSRRMGSDKALLPAPGSTSRTFIEQLALLLASHCAEVLLVARDPASSQGYVSLASPPRWRVTYDQTPDQGPLMGLASGLRAITYSHALVIAVDLPCIQPALLAWLAAFPLTEEVLVPRISSIPQVLLARYPRAILPTIETCLCEGRRDPRALLKRVPVHFLDEEQVRALDPDLRSFLNVNTPEDFAQISTLEI